MCDAYVTSTWCDTPVCAVRLVQDITNTVHRALNHTIIAYARSCVRVRECASVRVCECRDECLANHSMTQYDAHLRRTKRKPPSSTTIVVYYYYLTYHYYYYYYHYTYRYHILRRHPNNDESPPAPVKPHVTQLNKLSFYIDTCYVYVCIVGIAAIETLIGLHCMLC